MMFELEVYWGRADLHCVHDTYECPLRNSRRRRQYTAVAQMQRRKLLSELPLEVWCCGMLVTFGGDDDRQANLQR